ncbi:MAG TPA: DUF6345 domain-containing protein [Rugosimonospora sp.]|nr:DUF6345 domain-containing protein [Rugosimonospora sp.]
MSRTTGRRGARLAAAASVAAVAGTLLVGGTAAVAGGGTAAVYAVVQEGLTPDQGAKLAGTFNIPNALETDGAFSYADPARFNQVPQVAVAKGEDESGRPTVAQALDVKALDAVKAPSDDAALSRANQLLQLVGLSGDFGARPSVSHTQLTLSNADNKVTRSQALDTVVTYGLTLGGLPVTGQGARLRLTLAPDGVVSQVSASVRQVAKSGDVPVIPVEQAQQECAALYGPDVRQDVPTLGYQFPQLTADQANGRGTVGTIYPQYTCNPLAETSQAHRLVPAVPGSGPGGRMKAARTGDSIVAAVEVSGGTAPYTYAWSSSSTALPSDDRSRPSISYTRAPRAADTGTETVTVEVTDANGLTATAAVRLDADGSADAATTPGGGGFGALAVGPVDTGIEQTVDWQCAQAGADGFRNGMLAHGVPVAFDWRLANAWESDFKDPALGGHDDQWVDNVDAAWYTGHGNPSGFTFTGMHDDQWIVPGDARWGNRDLEWLQLESCQVLADTSGTYDYFARWRPAFVGLHILNGFHTNAYCVGTTGGTFANYLFPVKFLWWTLRPAYRVQAAWAAMAVDTEPSGVVYRSMGLIRPDGVTNIGDYFWGQGPTGPDIPASPSNGMWSISGTV